MSRTKKIVIDLDHTLTLESGSDYESALPNLSVIEKVREYKGLNFEIIIHTSRNMRTFGGNVGKINAHTLPQILRWLEKHSIPFDEIHVGKPWCGEDGFYVDDRAIRPNEFANLNLDQIYALIKTTKSNEN